ncbi:hypothetical protein SCLCIDRAFT_319153 [Scleroderma citrinum Foug A]|uniref:Uncharacterized protein n=1 Tax=Scleroderma citrinum Foug A TaxID=1036808 RepID=A0A0C3AN22_9AGAM|nr:hypothetical protein SCLCIDRAFT_319153 [Scleroderma citrinum Foug A]
MVTPPFIFPRNSNQVSVGVDGKHPIRLTVILQLGKHFVGIKGYLALKPFQYTKLPFAK